MGFKQTFTQALTEASTTAKEAVGTIRDEGSKVYKYILYNDGDAEAGTLNQFCYYWAVTGAQAGVVTCDVSGADAQAMAAGQLKATLADTEYGWIQIAGISAISPIDADGSTPVIGDAMGGYAATTDGALGLVAAADDPGGAIIINVGTGVEVYFMNFPR